MKKTRLKKAGESFPLKRTPQQDDFYHMMNGKFCGAPISVHTGSCSGCGKRYVSLLQ